MTVRGIIDEIIFRNDDNGFTIINIVTDDSLLTVKGNMYSVSVGESIEAEGEYIHHNLYGYQFNAKWVKAEVPKSTVGLQNYLASGAIKGVKKTLAKRIIDQFGEETLDILENDPIRLSEVKGISVNKAKLIGEEYFHQGELRNAFIFLSEYKISFNFCMKIYNKYKGKTYDIIKGNPYLLAEDITGISFKKADQIAREAGIEPTSVFRIKSCIKYVLKNSLGNGHIFLYYDELISSVKDLIGDMDIDYDNILLSLFINKEIVIKENEETKKIYLNEYYNMENYCAFKLLQISSAKTTQNIINDTLIGGIEKTLDIKFAENQKKCFHETFDNNLLLITGGPGTGKTTTLLGILQLCSEVGLKTLLAAPTGRAAKRMSETTGYEAKTIHRLLDIVTNDEGKIHFNQNEDNPLECDVVIIDEVSMLDTMLLYYLLRAITVGTKLILVGDKDQLPSVGAGNTINDIITSNIIPIVKLDIIFRQANQSHIVTNAHLINSGVMISEKNDNKDFFVIKRENAGKVSEEILSLVKDRLPKFLKTDNPLDIQVLSPMKKGVLGINELNNRLQSVLNPASEEKSEKLYKDIIFRENDKVMQIKNNYNLAWRIYGFNKYIAEEGLGVFNGDTGTIKSINKFSETITVLFDDRKEVEYKYADLEELTLAYAITIHKSQGSEYKCVIIPIFNGPRPLLTRNLLYTAVTRASEVVVLVGNPSTIKLMIDNNHVAKRNSSLAERLIEYKDIHE